jgi:hypothetical protein
MTRGGHAVLQAAPSFCLAEAEVSATAMHLAQEIIQVEATPDFVSLTPIGFTARHSFGGERGGLGMKQRVFRFTLNRERNTRFMNPTAILYPWQRCQRSLCNAQVDWKAGSTWLARWLFSGISPRKGKSKVGLGGMPRAGPPLGDRQGPFPFCSARASHTTNFLHQMGVRHPPA